MRFTGVHGCLLALLTAACGQVAETGTSRVVVVSGGAIAAASSPVVSPLPAVAPDLVASEQRQQEAIDLAATDRFPVLPPDHLELARESLASDGTDGV